MPLFAAQHFNRGFKDAVENILRAALLALEEAHRRLLGVGIGLPVKLHQPLFGGTDLHGSLGRGGGGRGLLCGGGGLFGGGLFGSAALGGVQERSLSDAGGLCNLLEGSLGKVKLAPLSLADVAGRNALYLAGQLLLSEPCLGACFLYNLFVLLVNYKSKRRIMQDASENMLFKLRAL